MWCLTCFELGNFSSVIRMRASLILDNVGFSDLSCAKHDLTVGADFASFLRNGKTNSIALMMGIRSTDADLVLTHV